MGADQVAAIRPAIAELEADEQATGSGQAARYFARFSHAPHGGPWVEVYLESHAVVNFWYPFDPAPLEYLRVLGVITPPGARVTDLIRPSCTLAFDRGSTRQLAQFVDALFTEVFACGADYPVDVEICRFPSMRRPTIG